MEQRKLHRRQLESLLQSKLLFRTREDEFVPYVDELGQEVGKEVDEAASEACA
jgi:hypothetical protein